MVRCTRYNCSSVSDVVPIGGFLRFPPPNSIDRHDIAEILLKVVLSAISLNLICVIVIICSLAFTTFFLTFCQKVSYLNLPGQSLYGGFANII
jgi:hypothetical protein